MIRSSQMCAADDAARAIADAVEALRKVEESLIRAGLYDAHNALQGATSAVMSVGVDLRMQCRETYTALRAGKDVPR